MSFGFSAEDIEDADDNRPKIEYSLSDKLTSLDWKDLEINMRVQSTLTGTSGTIVGLHNKWNEVSISWDNNNETFAQLKYLSKVIVVSAT